MLLTGKTVVEIFNLSEILSILTTMFELLVR